MNITNNTRTIIIVVICMFSNLLVFSQVRQAVKIIDIETKKPVSNMVIEFVNAEKAVTNKFGIAIVEDTISNIGDKLFFKDINSSEYRYYSVDFKNKDYESFYVKDTLLYYVIKNDTYNKLYSSLKKGLYLDMHNNYSKLLNNYTDSLPGNTNVLSDIYSILNNGVYNSLSSIHQSVNEILSLKYIFEKNKPIQEAIGKIEKGEVFNAIKGLEESIDIKNNYKSNTDLEKIYFFLKIIDLDSEYNNKTDLKPYYISLIEGDYHKKDAYYDYLFYLMDRDEKDEFEKIYTQGYNLYKNSFQNYWYLRIRSIYSYSVENDLEKSIQFSNQIIDTLLERNKKWNNIYDDIIASQYNTNALIYSNAQDYENAYKMKEKAIDYILRFDDNDLEYKNNQLSNWYFNLLYFYNQTSKDTSLINITYNKAIQTSKDAFKNPNYDFEYLLNLSEYVLSEDDKDIELIDNLKLMAKEYSKDYPYFFSHTYYRLSNLKAFKEYSIDNDLEKLDKEIDNSIKILDSLNTILPYVYSFEYVSINKLRASIAVEMENNELKVERMKNIVRLCEEYMAFDSLNYSYDLADYAIPLAENYYSKEDYKTAEQYYLKAERGLKILSSLDSSYYYQLGSHYNAMGDAYLHQEEYDKAIEIYNRSMELEDKVLLSQKEYYNKILGNAYFFRGDAKRAKEDYKSALEDYIIADNHFQKSLLVDTTTLLVLGELEIARGFTFYTIGQKQEAEKSFKKSVDYFEKGVKGIIFNKYITALNLLIEIYKENNDVDNFLINKNKLIKVYDDYSKLNYSYAYNYIETTNELANLYSKAKDSKTSMDYYRLGLNKALQLEEIGAEVKKTKLGLLFNIGDKEMDNMLLDSAAIHFKEALEINKICFMDTAYAIYVQNNKEIYEKLGITYCMIGDNNQDEKYSYQDGKAYLLKAVESLEEMNFAESDKSVYNMSNLNFILGQINSNLGQSLEAEKSYKRAISLLLPLSLKDNYDLNGDMQKYHIYLGRLYMDKMDNDQRAREMFIQANLYYNNMSSENKNYYLEEYINTLDNLLLIEMNKEDSQDKNTIKILKKDKKKAEKRLKKNLKKS